MFVVLLAISFDLPRLWKKNKAYIKKTSKKLSFLVVFMAKPLYIGKIFFCKKLRLNVVYLICSYFMHLMAVLEIVFVFNILLIFLVTLAYGHSAAICAVASFLLHLTI